MPDTRIKHTEILNKSSHNINIPYLLLYPRKTGFVENPFEKWSAEIAFARIRQNRNNCFPFEFIHFLQASERLQSLHHN